MSNEEPTQTLTTEEQEFIKVEKRREQHREANQRYYEKNKELLKTAQKLKYHEDEEERRKIKAISMRSYYKKRIQQLTAKMEAIPYANMLTT
jgi:hypothetical protein